MTDVWIGLRNKSHLFFFFCLKETYLTAKDKYRVKIFQTLGAFYQAGVTVTQSHKADFKPDLEETKNVNSYW
jgi:hypothetical protein